MVNVANKVSNNNESSTRGYFEIINPKQLDNGEWDGEFL